MKKMNVVKGIAVCLFTASTVGAMAQTDTTRNRTDTSGHHRGDSLRSSYPKQDYRVTDLGTSQAIDIYYDTVDFRVMNKTTNAPVEFYILNGVDTVHGATGLIVNGMLMRLSDGTYDLDSARVKIDGDEIKLKYADGRKVKWENGKMKIKEWGTKAKSKGDKEKMKNQWGRVRWKDGEWTVDKDSE